MGLDITAYSRIHRVERDAYPTKTMNEMIEHGHFLEISEGILKSTETSFPGRSGGIKPGIYCSGDRFSFRAGSYSGYGQWRNWLAQFGNWKDAQDCWERGDNGQPFFELINFFDNEGIIGAKVAAKLAFDFAQHEGDAIARDKSKDFYDLHMYRRWKFACELASEDGCIDFH